MKYDFYKSVALDKVNYFIPKLGSLINQHL